MAQASAVWDRGVRFDASGKQGFQLNMAKRRVRIGHSQETIKKTGPTEVESVCQGTGKIQLDRKVKLDDLMEYFRLATSNWSNGQRAITDSREGK